MRQNATVVQPPLKKPLSSTKGKGVLFSPIFSDNGKNNIQSSAKKQGKASSEKKRRIRKKADRSNQCTLLCKQLTSFSFNSPSSLQSAHFEYSL